MGSQQLTLRWARCMPVCAVAILTMATIPCLSGSSQTTQDYAQVAFSRYDLELRGLGPRGIFAEDLNGDEIPDLVVANLGHEQIPESQSLNVFFGRGDGTFDFAQSIPVDEQNEPYGIAFADLRDGGYLDVIVPNKDAGTVSVFLGREDGAYELPQAYPANDAWSVTTADFDGDNKVDVAVANFDTEAISLLLGKGDGTFKTPVRLAVPAGFKPRDAGAADVNGDGKIDLVIPSDTQNGRVAVFLNVSRKRRPSFNLAHVISVGAYTGAVLINDINGDGKPDIVASSLLSNYVSILLGTGGGNFASPLHYFAGDVWPFGLALTDVDGDGNSDLITSGVKNARISVLPGDGYGRFSSPSLFGVQAPSRVLTWADFNLDGAVDVAVGNYTATGRFDATPGQFFKTVSILLNRAGRGPWSSSARVNCGGEAYISARGIRWNADLGYEGGRIITTESNIDGTSDGKLFQSAREGDFTYSVRVNPGRSYTVRLYFSEIKPARRRRLFNVAVNGEAVLNKVDLSAVPRNRAISKTIRQVWPDRSGQIRVSFSSVQRGALCSAISVF